MIDRLKDLFYKYYDQFMTWYNASDEVTQIAVIVGLSIAVIVLLVLMILSMLIKK